MIRSLVWTLVLLPSTLWAAPNFNLLTESEFKDISREMSANFMHHSVQGAAPLGSVFGFELGVVGGMQKSPGVQGAVERSGGSGLTDLYHGGILGVVSVPFGITGEVALLPKTSMNESSIEATSLGLKLSLNSLIPSVLPVNLALRGIHSTAKLSFQQTISGTASSVVNETKITGLQLLVAPSLPLIEPYAGVGYVSGKNSLSASAGNLFDPAYSPTPSQEHSESSTQVLLGVTANLLILHVGAEYSNAFGASTYTGKLAIGF